MLLRTKRILKLFLNLANLVTYSRAIFAFIVIFLIYSKSLYYKLAALILIIVIFWMDWLDGYLARKYGLASSFGGVVDVAGDRIVENSLWISFAYLQLVPLWAPLIVISRSFVTDGVRSFALTKGKGTFAMMHSSLGKALVASRWSRGLYAISKAAAFGLVVIVHILDTSRFDFLTGFEYLVPVLAAIAKGTVIFVVAFCVIRGALTVYDSRKLFMDAK